MEYSTFQSLFCLTTWTIVVDSVDKHDKFSDEDNMVNAFLHSRLDQTMAEAFFTMKETGA